MQLAFFGEKNLLIQTKELIAVVPTPKSQARNKGAHHEKITESDNHGDGNAGCVIGLAGFISGNELHAKCSKNLKLKKP